MEIDNVVSVWLPPEDYSTKRPFVFKTETRAEYIRASEERRSRGLEEIASWVGADYDVGHRIDDYLHSRESNEPLTTEEIHAAVRERRGSRYVSVWKNDDGTSYEVFDDDTMRIEHANNKTRNERGLWSVVRFPRVDRFVSEELRAYLKAREGEGEITREDLRRALGLE